MHPKTKAPSNNMSLTITGVNVGPHGTAVCKYGSIARTDLRGGQTLMVSIQRFHKSTSFTVQQFDKKPTKRQKITS